MEEPRIETAHFHGEACCGQTVDTEMTVGESRIPDSVKQDVINWTKSILKLKIKDLRAFTGIWADGIYLCKLLNIVLKDSEIKFYSNRPINKTQARINLKQAFIALRRRVSFKSDYLYCENQVLKGAEGVIWGLLFDLKTYSSNLKSKLSPSLLSLSEDFLRQQAQSFINRPNSVSWSNNNEMPQSQVTIAHIRQVKSWLSKLGLSELAQIDNGHFFQNPFKNGLILNEILKKLEKPIEFNEDANTKPEVLQNLENCLTALSSFPGVLTANITPISILYGSEEATWGLLFSLSQIFPNPPSPPLSLYNSYQRSDLIASLKQWLLSLNIQSNTNILTTDIVFETAQKICGCTKDNILETLKIIFHIEELNYSDFEESDILLLFLENLHRYADSYPMQIERNYTCSIYLGRGIVL